MYKLMIFFNKYPDSANDPQGRNLGPINGLGTLIPVVTCPDASIGDRCPLQKCFGCQQFVRHNGFMLECKYAAPKVIGEKDKQTITVNKKEIKKPTGVFDPTE